MGAFFIVKNGSIPADSKNTPPVGAVHELIATAGVPAAFFKAVNGPEGNLDCTLCISVLALAQDDIFCESSSFVAVYSASTDGVRLDNMSLPCSLNSQILWNERLRRVAVLLMP